jgi:nitrogenase subunit NifH
VVKTQLTGGSEIGAIRRSLFDVLGDGICGGHVASMIACGV